MRMNFRMKCLLFAAVLFSLLMLMVAIFIEPAISFVAKKQLEKVFIGSQVSIGSCRFRPLRQISLFEVEIKEPNIYNLKVKEAGIHFSLFSLLSRNILKFSLKDPLVDIHLGQKSLVGLRSSLRISSSRLFVLQDLELSRAMLKLNSKEANVSGEFSVGLNAAKPSLNTLNGKIDFIAIQDFRLEEASLLYDKEAKPGQLNIALIKYNKAKIENVSAKLRLENGALFLDALAAQIFGGKVEGDLVARLEKDLGYEINFNFTDLDLERFIDDFDLKEKFQMTGRLSGRVSLKGSGLNINSVSGGLRTSDTGGFLTITDKRMLENLARTSQQSMDILVESFRNYHYNIGTIKLGLDNGNLILDVSLEGEAGKRNLNIIVHEFKIGGGDDKERTKETRSQ